MRFPESSPCWRSPVKTMYRDGSLICNHRLFHCSWRILPYKHPFFAADPTQSFTKLRSGSGGKVPLY